MLTVYTTAISETPKVKVKGGAQVKACLRLLMAGLLLAALAFVSAQEVRQIRWATSAVGSSGHAAKVNLMAVLNREMPDYSITVLPTPGAIATVRGYALEEFDGYYGADIAFMELAQDAGRFAGFRDEMIREPVQSFWAFTLETGMAIHARDIEEVNEWRDLSGMRVFTGPLPWDVRANLERAMNALGIEHEYVDIDLGLVASSLDAGDIRAFIVYTAGEADVAPWITEVELSTDIAVLNPSEEELDMLREAGLGPVQVDPVAFETEVHADEAYFVPFFYGFHVGLEIPEDDVYRMLTVIEEHATELMQADPSFTQIAEDMAEFQRRGVAASIDYVMVHPGLARYMQERGVWDEAWNDRIAQQ
jgi:uncharacterized protein